MADVVKELNPIPVIKSKTVTVVVIVVLALLLGFAYDRRSGGKLSGMLAKVPFLGSL